MTDFCTYCNDVHEMRHFGLDFWGNEVLVCDIQLSDALAKTMPKQHNGLDVEIIEE